MWNKYSGKYDTTKVFTMFFMFFTTLAGCAYFDEGPKHFVLESANLEYIKKVAVLPFNNLTADNYAGEKLKSAVIMEVLERDVFEVAEDGEVNKVIAEVFRDLGYREGDLVALDMETIQIVSEKLDTNAVFVGTVESYGQTRSGSGTYSIVSMNLQLIEANSGTTIWRGSYSKVGHSALKTVFGMEQQNELSITREVVKMLLDTLIGD